MQLRFIGAVIICLLVSACKSGEGEDPVHPITDLRTIRAAIPGNDLNLSSEQIRSVVVERLGSSNSVMTTDVFNLLGQAVAVITCDGTVCNFGGQQFDITGFSYPRTQFHPVMKLNGVPVVQGLAIDRFGAGTQSLTIGGWTDHSWFIFDGSVFGISLPGPSDQRTLAIASSVGETTGSVPSSGSATWKGIVVAGDLANREALLGEATLSADFLESNIDAEFTNFHDFKTGSEHEDIYFMNVPFTSDGFKKGSPGNKIEGLFYGPNHAEASGIFEYESRIGAFGTNRVRP